MLRRLLLKNISISQIIGYALATLIGLSIVACAVKFYADAKGIFAPSGGESALISDSYPVISKPVSMFNAFGSSTAFTPAEIADLKDQPWVRDLAPFLPANFSVVASVDIFDTVFSTHTSLEAIPDDFIDVRPPGWDYNPETNGCVPIIIPKDYLNLYNFGFATARGLPRITPGVLSQVPINLSLSGPEGNLTLCASIVGFSSRLNTIAVPMAFMEWANSTLAPGAPSAPSRLIVRVSDSTDPAIADYLQSHGYEISGADAGASRAASLLRIVAGIIIGIGLVISILALIILLLSINLLIQKNHATISTLIFLGYTPGRIARRYIAGVVILNILLATGAIVAMLAASSVWATALAPFDITPAPATAAIITTLGLTLLLTLINALTIHHHITTVGKIKPGIQ